MRAKPLVSVIMPLYNVGRFVSESVDSLVAQTIGFDNNIELIMVDDGSIDNTAAVCRSYIQRYPNNIRYIKQKNQGVSAARNNGLKLARGKYINFFDADDIWQKDAYKKAISFLKDNEDVDFVAAKVKFFDRSIDEHPLKYKFTKNRVIDVATESDSPIMHIISCIIRREALDGKSFDTRLVIAEDAKLLNEVLAGKKRFGVLANTQYNYRKRGNNSSAIDSGQQKKEYYLNTPALAYESMADTWTSGDKLHPYMQHLLLYDFSYRICGAPYQLLSSDEEKEYAHTMLGLIKRISPENIKSSRWYSEKQKQYLLSIRSKRTLEKFGFVDNHIEQPKVAKHPVLKILFNWRFGRSAEHFKRLRRYNLTQLSLKARLIEYAKPWLIIAEAITDIPRALILRARYHFEKRHKSRELWLISDRVMAAGDNGEALFRYIQTQAPNADVYFVLSKKSSDYERVKEVGRTIDHKSWNYLVKFLLADKIISSHADIETTNPFIRNVDHYQDLIHHDFVFLQHGVISNDLSGWLNKGDKRIKLFITSAETERDSIINNLAYGYTADEVKVTGLARWDLLDNNPQNKLIIAPTFRASLLKTPTDKNGTRVYDPGFKQSDYFKFYDPLINDERIAKVLEENKMTGKFYIHPNFAQQADDFHPSKNIKVARFPYNYHQAVSEGSLLVSDYSSIAYDFAYLYKPVIYAQFDEKQFYQSHSYTKGYFFSYEKDGFGPVCQDYESTVQSVVDAIQSGCVLEPKYKQRIDKFFTYHDKKNSERIYQAISK
jgi:glycosyltransferase involved in cell wall biosynthesis